MKANYLKITDHSDKKVASNGYEFMTITLKDLNNGNKVDYNIYKNNDQTLWNAIEKSDYKDKKIPGKVMDINVTNELIKNATVNKPDAEYELSNSFRMVVWEWSEWKNLSEKTRIINSLKNQVWKLNKKYISKDFGQSKSHSFPQDMNYKDKVYRVDDPASDPNQNPWIEVFGEGEEAKAAYWNTH